MISQTLSQKMLQKMSPQQIQLMKLLQIPTIELEQRIKEEIETNPALEEGQADSEDLHINDDDEPKSSEDENFDFEEYFPEYSEEDQGYRSAADGYQQEDQPARQIAANENNLQEYLEQQLNMVDFTDTLDRTIALQIIGSIDDDGYLRRELIAIADDLLFSLNISISEKRVDQMLKVIQSFEPKGVGARNLQEALLIQIRAKIDADTGNSAERLKNLQLAETILADYFAEFSKKHFSKLINFLNISEEELKDVFEEILRLNPKPANNQFSADSIKTQYIEPDFIIVNRDGELEMSLNNRNSPDLHINTIYKNMLRDFRKKREEGTMTKQDKDTAMFVRQKIESAQIFIESLKKRYATLYHTMYSIMMKQYDFFLTGDTALLKPMILKDIADEIGVDISTVSRVANSKYVQTEFGTKLLKDFFSDSIQSNDGKDVTTVEVRKVLTNLIDAEDKNNPLSDEKLMELLSKSGFTLSRRTIAKYREKLNIPVARMRREM